MAQKQAAIDEKGDDKENSPASTIVISTDCQALLLSPINNSHKMYFHSKLNIHNQSYYNLKTNEGSNYLWNETEGGVDDNVFTTVHIHHLKQELSENPQATSLIMYTDNCGAQNKNSTLSSALLQLASEKGVEITQKFLIVGHTHMECDTMHQKIETRKKNRSINRPIDYEDIIKEVRRYPAPYKVKTLSPEFFKNYDAIDTVKNIRPGRKAGDDCVNDLSQIKYTPDGKIFLKLIGSSEWKDLPRRYSVNKLKVGPLYKERIKLSAAKYKHLMELKTTIDKVYWSFYEELPHK